MCAFAALILNVVVAAIDAWIDRQPDPRPSRSEVIRRLIEKGLVE